MRSLWFVELSVFQFWRKLSDFYVNSRILLLYTGVLVCMVISMLWSCRFDPNYIYGIADILILISSTYLSLAVWFLWFCLGYLLSHEVYKFPSVFFRFRNHFWGSDSGIIFEDQTLAFWGLYIEGEASLQKVISS